MAWKDDVFPEEIPIVGEVVQIINRNSNDITESMVVKRLSCSGSYYLVVLTGCEITLYYDKNGKQTSEDFEINRSFIE